MEIRLARGTDAEARTRDALYRLLEKHDLGAWIFTNTMVVDETARPHSHPVLTIHTARSGDERMLLSLFVHEQLHWFEEERAAGRDLAIEQTRQWYPSVPDSPPEGAANETSTRLHLLVCYLEHQAMAQLVGAEAAHEVIQALSRNHYCWIYRTILEDGGIIRRILQDYNLLPEPLRAGDPGLTVP